MASLKPRMVIRPKILKPKDLNLIADYYEKELIAAKADIKINGKVEKELSNLPGETEHRFNQLQEIEAVLEHLNIQLRKIRQKRSCSKIC